MEKTPKSLRLQIGIFGRTNVGKSSFLNLVAGQDVAITSPLPGTTTDVVEKTMELLPVGPVVFLDTGGLDDVSTLGAKRIERTRRIFDRADVIVLVLEPDQWTEFEKAICTEAEARKTPLIFVVNKSDLKTPSPVFLKKLKERSERVLICASTDQDGRNAAVTPFKAYLLEVCPEDFLKAPAMLGDLMPRGGVAVLIVPIDFEAPKGRIILPQVQAIRDALDHNSMTLVVKESEYKTALSKLKGPPDLVVCDSQVVDRMVAETPKGVRCTTFSILLSRLKGDMAIMTRGVFAIRDLRPGDKILIAESCSHHAIEGDIGRVKIPAWLNKHLGFEVGVKVAAGRDFPDNVTDYKLILQCGSCMLTRREALARIQRASQKGVPITNYGLCISYLQGVLERVIEPFPEAWKVCQEFKTLREKGDPADGD
ncbi:MAG: [FeFe] hydrogenase H-cluster maturation GTPase HydF [Candidatus Omnitrophica bacterium]|nr:[FeFe] hydrogenase H-cluster maturation GTPase HydF [Candidatus Omnitrophota bacterium]